MNKSEVFRPTSGPLMVPSALSAGLPQPTDSYRKDRGSRPSTQGGYRFGQHSHNSFFVRHNPHPGRVRHLKGLLDIPICSVNDQGYFASPRYSLQFPPNNFANLKLQDNHEQTARLPANAVNVNSTLHPINTITGLQYFMGKPLKFRVFREKAVPGVGVVPITEAWRDELRALLDASGLAKLEKKDAVKMDEGRPRTSQYSTETGRLIPPPSRAMSRQGSRQASRNGSRHGSRMQLHGGMDHICEESDLENVVLQMMCQILQTDDLNAVQAWLVSAGDREKSMMFDMIKAAMGSEESADQPPDQVAERPHTTASMPAVDVPVNGIIGDPAPGDDIVNNIDRLTLDNIAPRPGSRLGEEHRFARHSYEGPTQRLPTPKHHEQAEVTLAPVTPNVFRPRTSAQGERPMSRLSRGRTPGSKPAPSVPAPAPRLRYTVTPLVALTVQEEESEEEPHTESTWRPQQAVVQN